MNKQLGPSFKKALFVLPVFLVSISAALIATSCTPKVTSFRTAEWSPYTTNPSSLEEVESHLSSFTFIQKSQVFFHGEASLYKTQTVFDIPILDTWVKENKDLKDGKKTFLSYKIVENETLPKLPLSFFKGSSEYQTAVKKIRSLKLPIFKIESLNPAYRALGNNLNPVWVVSGIDDRKFVMKEYVLDAESFKILIEKEVGSKFQTQIPVVRAHAFPKGPKKSALSEVTLLNLNPGLELSNLKIQVTSNTGQNVSVTPQPLIFDPKDQRFSQVQVFYTLQEANLWFEQNLGWSWAGRLKVETQLGHPEKINSAFYYANRIRLGEGDGVIYENIPFDPSIVVHESTHALIDRLSSLPFQGEGGSINEAYADFITSCQQNSSALGETAYKLGPYTRNLSSSLNWHDLNGGLYNDSLVLSTFFWSLKEKIGEQTTLKLLLKVLRDTRPDENLESFKRKLIIQSKLILPPQEQKSFNQLLNERKWL